MDIRGHISHVVRVALLAGVLLGALFAAPAWALGGGGSPTWLTQSQLTGTGLVSGVQVAMDSQGDALSVWIDGAGAVDFSYRAAGGSNFFSSPAGVTGAGVAPSNLHLAMDPNGDAVAVWDEGGNTVWAAPFSHSNPSSFGTTLVNIAGTGAHPATSPQVAIDNSGNAEFVWIDNDSGAHHILQAAFLPSGGSLGTVQNLTNDGQHDAANPQVAFDTAGDAVAAWQQSDGTDVLVESSVQPQTPTPTFGATTALSSDADGNAADLSLGSTPNSVTVNGEVTAVWDNGTNVDAAYMPISSLTFNATQTAIGTGTLPAVAMDGLGNAIAVWQDSSELIQAAALEAGALPPQQFGTAMQLSTTGDTSANPHIATGANNESIAVWQDNTAGEIEAAVQTTPQFPTPSFSTPPTAISSSGNSPASPSVAVADTGDAVAGWQQGASAQAQVAGYDNGPQFPPPDVQIPNAPYAGHAVTLSVNPTDVWSTLNASTASWTFGDTGTASGITDATHTYASTGPKNVKFTITDTQGVDAQQPVSQPLTVGTQPAAVPGGLFQLDSPNDCATGASWGCGTLLSFQTGFAYQPAVSSDGKNVYFASLFGGLAVFSRDASTGALTNPSCLTNSASGCATNNVQGLSGPAGVAVSPDGKNVYAIGQSDNAIVAFARDPLTGALTFHSCIAETGSSSTCSTKTAVGLDNPYGIAVSSDGKNVYVTSNGNGGEVAVFGRQTNGDLTQPASDCISGVGGVGCSVNGADGMANAVGVAVSPDGSNVYVEAGGTGAAGDVAEFTRNSTTGDLTELGCIGAATGGCTSNMSGTDINGTEDMAISPDGRFAYINSFSNNSVVELSRNTSTGALSQIGATSGATGLGGPLGVALSPDGANVYASGAGSNAEAAFARNPSTGALTQLASPFDCIGDNSSGCGQAGATGLGGARRVVISPDGKNVYVAGQNSGAIAALSRSYTPGDADLALSVSGAPANATPGADFTYAYTVTNNGPAAVANPVLNVTLSSLLSGTAPVTSQGSCSGQVCRLGYLGPGTSATVQIPVSTLSTGTATTTAVVTPSLEIVDPNAANNSTSSSTTIQTPPPPPPGGALGPPVLHKSANAYPVAGKVYVKLPGTNNFIPLSEAKQLPVGTVVDARHGTIELVFAKPGGGTMTGQYWGGEFTFTQAANGHVTITLIGPLGGKYTSRKGPIAIVARGRPGRSLWSNVHGNFTTRGHASSGSARGTEWLTQDYRNGTKITVTRDVVLVTNLKTHKTQHVHAGHSIFITG